MMLSLLLVMQQLLHLLLMSNLQLPDVLLWQKTLLVLWYGNKKLMLM